MDYSLLGAPFGLAVLDWVTVWKGWRAGEYILKPATLLALLAWFWQTTGLQGQALWFGLGLLFSLLGDIFMMLPYHLFMAGLVAFLLAHLAYTVGFNLTLPPINPFALILALLVMLAAARFYRQVMRGLAHKPGNSLLKRGALAYTIAITLMVISALTTLVRPGWSQLSAAMTAIGSLFFFTSDSVLALNRFVSPIRNERLIVMVTYHLGQILLILGVARHLSGF